MSNLPKEMQTCPTCKGAGKLAWTGVDISGQPLKTRWHDRFNCAPWWMFWDDTSGGLGGAIAAIISIWAILGIAMMVWRHGHHG